MTQPLLKLAFRQCHSQAILTVFLQSGLRYDSASSVVTCCCQAPHQRINFRVFPPATQDRALTLDHPRVINFLRLFSTASIPTMGPLNERRHPQDKPLYIDQSDTPPARQRLNM